MKKVFVALFLLCIPGIALAQGFQFDPGGGIASSLNLPTRDAQSAVISVIQYILTLLGLIAVIIIIYAGFRYLTSAGNEEVIKQSRGILKGAAIGLLLILLAQAILLSVVTVFTNVTT